MRRMLDLAQHQMQELRTNFAEVIKQNHPLSTQEELEMGADQTLIWLTGSATYGIIKRISRSVGLKDLELTFDEVRAKLGGRTSVELIHLSILLEYFRDAPKAEITKSKRWFVKNPFCLQTSEGLSVRVFIPSQYGLSICERDRSTLRDRNKQA